MGQLTCSAIATVIYTRDMHKRFEKLYSISSMPIELNE